MTHVVTISQERRATGDGDTDAESILAGRARDHWLRTLPEVQKSLKLGQSMPDIIAREIGSADRVFARGSRLVKLMDEEVD